MVYQNNHSGSVHHIHYHDLLGADIQVSVAPSTRTEFTTALGAPVVTDYWDGDHNEETLVYVNCILDNYYYEFGQNGV